ncbi:hypothetical protein JGS22_007985 [Streptomyces sp. P38-E01]|uniref:Uncharacterized protein n=1 Tax=Streptomyces tardus TaxID=2780544 RepID=A0A949N534_9ACTN|nr:hypothetical protein [Streptomyces tardus]MBU7597562.1 hypothetical protein [Streptomyces tardus]
MTTVDDPPTGNPAEEPGPADGADGANGADGATAKEVVAGAGSASLADGAEAEVVAGLHERTLRVLDRLLYDARFRETFVSGGPRSIELGLEADLLDAFDLVDTRELVQVGRNIRSDVTSGGTGTGLGLARTFPRTLRAVRERGGGGLKEVAEEFIASPSFQEFRDVPFSPRGRGRTLPECFHRWVADHPRHTRQGSLEPLAYHEAAEAVVRTVSTGADATFDVGMPGAARHGDTLCIFRDYASAPPVWKLRPTIYLAGNSRCVVGGVSPAVYGGLVAVLGGRAESLPVRVREALERRLRNWGLR